MATDVSLQRDCHLGRHASSCSGATVGVAVTETSFANGLLRVVAGSRRVAIPIEVAKTDPYLRVVAIPTQPRGSHRAPVRHRPGIDPAPHRVADEEFAVCRDGNLHGMGFILVDETLEILPQRIGKGLAACAETAIQLGHLPLERDCSCFGTRRHEAGLVLKQGVEDIGVLERIDEPVQ